VFVEKQSNAQKTLMPDTSSAGEGNKLFGETFRRAV
jgi:hypothetical protein